MNTQADGLYGTLIQERLMNLESATPGVDQPSRWVDGREVDKGVVIPFPIMDWSQTWSQQRLGYRAVVKGFMIQTLGQTILYTGEFTFE